MLNQKDLFGEVLENPKNKEELNAVCCEPCYTAKEDKCTCRCHGAFHGLGNHNKEVKRSGENEEISEDFFLTEEEAEPFRKQITRKYCHCCGVDLSKEPISAYGPHSGGYTVYGYDEPLWLFIKCPKCKSDWSIWNLGVERERI